MSDLSLGFLGIVVLLVLLFLNIPVAFALGVLGSIGLIMLAGVEGAIGMMGGMIFQTTRSYSLTTLPLYIIMGSFILFSGTGERLFDTCNKWFGRFPGGLAIATIGGCAGFAAMCGSSVATAAAVGSIAIPEMKQARYDARLRTGCVASGGTLGILIPPSAFMVIYGYVTDTSIGSLFIGGIIPGLIVAAVWMLTVYVWTKLEPAIAPMVLVKYSWKERIVSLKETWVVVLVVGGILGGILFGIITPTEGGAIGAFLGLVLMLASKKRSFANLTEALLDAGRATCMVILIIVGAFIFGAFLSYAGLPKTMAQFIVSTGLPAYGTLALVLLLYIVLGCLMEGIAMVLITMPIIFPIIMTLGFNPIWFGIIMTMMVMIGQTTPPLAMTVFAIRGIAPDVPLNMIYMGIYRFLFPVLGVVVLLSVFPQIVLFLPDLMKK